MLNTIKNLIFSQAEPKSEYEQRLNKLIKEKSGLKFLSVLRILTIVFGILLLKNVMRAGGTVLLIYVFLLIIILISFFTLNLLKRKQRQSYHFLFKAIEFIRKSQYNLALDKMIEAYKLSKNDELLQIIKDFSEEYSPTQEQEILITEFILNTQKSSKNKDKKLQEILNQIQNVSEYILKHKKSVANSVNKINDLKISLTKAKEERLKTEYHSLVKRYQNIIELEEAKISFYSNAKNELISLKNNHIENKKLLIEKEKLRDLEDNLLKKSIEEQYKEKDTVTDFISYENAYLEAIEEFSEQISSSNDHNLFEDIIKSFNNKTDNLLN